MSTIITKDGTEIYYKEWVTARSTFSHGWPLSADAGTRRCSSSPRTASAWWRTTGVAMAGPASPRRETTWTGTPTSRGRDRGPRPSRRHAGGPLHGRRGGGALHRAARDRAGRQGRPGFRGAADHGAVRRESGGPADRGIRRLACWSHQGPLAVLQGSGHAVLRRQPARSQGSQGVLDQFWQWSMQSGLKNAYQSIKAFSETDFTGDLKKFDVPTLVLHGEDDQIVPVRTPRGNRPRSSTARRKSTIRVRPMGSWTPIEISSTPTCWPSYGAEPPGRGGIVARQPRARPRAGPWRRGPWPGRGPGLFPEPGPGGQHGHLTSTGWPSPGRTLRP